VIAVLANLTVIHRMIYTWQETKRLEAAQLRAVPSSPELRAPSPAPPYA
jgi:CDP-diacylglycerol--glycerol-3-phosphate 3-phosphatidyltransferase